MKIAIGCDHAGYDLKESIKAALSNEYSIDDKGTYSSERADYADFAHPVAESVENGSNDKGILICGSANGIAMTANKHQGIRAAICWNEEITSLSRQHNDANIICLPARFISDKEALEFIRIFFSTEFEGGRHENRIRKIACS